jgi:hypothetical protein
MEKCSWIRDCFLGFGFHFEEDAAEDLNFFASGCDKRGFFVGGGKLSASERVRFAITGDKGGVEDGEEVGGSGAGSSGGGDEERVVLLLLL